MKKYSRPMFESVEETAEGVFAASGDNASGSEEKKVCKYGRTDANPGTDTCQGCSATNGASSDGKGYYRKDYKGCPEGLPEKS